MPTQPPHPTYLITGATGGLGHTILHTLLSSSIPPSHITATSTRASAGPVLAALGVRFAQLDYDEPATLDAAFAGVERLFFVSTNTLDNARRRRQRRNVVEAAERAQVGLVVYSSLAVGDVREDLEGVRLMGAHLETESLLRASKLKWMAVREVIYTDAFPVSFNWYPTDPTQTLYLPIDGAASFALRDELGVATAKLLMRGGFENEVVALTGPRAVRLSEIVNAINETTGRQVRIEYVADEEYVRRNVESDEGGKGEDLYWNWVTLFRAFRGGKMTNVSTLMEELSGRRPKDGLEGVRGLLMKDKDYTWHQNFARSK
ncbi:NmrA-like family protein [Phyllosticta citriasiana]|uniref:NmrA-like family protein n=1 Tax=Phyllosticta citriasiana TaxID=595635 RepID=UPI0030FDF043